MKSRARGRKPNYTGDNGYTYGPDFQIIPAMTLRTRPSRSTTTCPICGKPIDVRDEQAVIEERFDDRLVGGRFAHAECCRKHAKADA